MLLSNLILPRWVKGVSIVVLLGVAVGVGLKIYVSHQVAEANELKKEAARLREEAKSLRSEAQEAHSAAEDYKKQLVKANKDLAKLRAANDAVHVLPAPGPVPQKKQQLITDLQENGFELVLKPSSQIAPAYFGVTEADAGKMWENSMQALRIPSLELKIKTQNDLIGGLVDAKNIATAYAAQRTLEADAYHKAADTYQKESDLNAESAKWMEKAYKAERKKKLLYLVGGAAAGYFVERQLTH